MTRNRTAHTGGILTVLLGSFIAVAEGFSSLDCGSTPSILIVIAGSFGAGAGLAVAVSTRRTAKQSEAVASEDLRATTELLRQAAEEQRHAAAEQREALREMKEAAGRPKGSPEGDGE